ncbi:hypothetical protein MEBOL_007517 [Melittangium boletus DSM 14713]|uniref:Uncharacterized protein n=1 Tax=Melittangium boletus DSM 14713 TaxID=1294270 RepID=A0A250ISV1_9BACT|nr:hypothetical protein MEBOL_007517 [Melittangium boletus DSM 14713]
MHAQGCPGSFRKQAKPGSHTGGPSGAHAGRHWNNEQACPSGQRGSPLAHIFKHSIQILPGSVVKTVGSQSNPSAQEFISQSCPYTFMHTEAMPP